jgi:hypothetical protein
MQLNQMTKVYEAGAQIKHSRFHSLIDVHNERKNLHAAENQWHEYLIMYLLCFQSHLSTDTMF